VGHFFPNWEQVLLAQCLHAQCLTPHPMDPFNESELSEELSQPDQLESDKGSKYFVTMLTSSSRVDERLGVRTP